jgi:hypothetical protein
MFTMHAYFALGNLVATLHVQVFWPRDPRVVHLGRLKRTLPPEPPPHFPDIPSPCRRWRRWSDNERLRKGFFACVFFLQPWQSSLPNLIFLSTRSPTRPGSAASLHAYPGARWRLDIDNCSWTRTWSSGRHCEFMGVSGAPSEVFLNKALGGTIHGKIGWWGQHYSFP